MTIYIDKIIVSFSENENCCCEYEMIDIRYCPNYQICRSHLMLRTFNKNKEYNKLCRRRLDSMNRCKQSSSLYNDFKRKVAKNF